MSYSTIAIVVKRREKGYFKAATSKDIVNRMGKGYFKAATSKGMMQTTLFALCGTFQTGIASMQDII